MLKFDADQAWKEYQDKCTESYHWANYEAYNKRYKKMLKEEDKMFRRDWCLYWAYKDYYEFINYEYEIDILKFYWYKQYVDYFIYRREEAIDEELNPLEEDDDR